MDVQKRFEIQNTINAAANPSEQWPNGYLSHLMNFMTAPDPDTVTTAIGMIRSTVKWRNIAAQVSVQLRQVLISSMQSLSELPNNCVHDACMIRAYLSDDSVVNRFDDLVLRDSANDYWWCYLLGWLKCDKSREILLQMLSRSEELVRIRAALSLAMRGDESGIETLLLHYVPVWEEDRTGISVGVALARLGNVNGVSFVFSSCGDYLRLRPERFRNLIASLGYQVNEFGSSPVFVGVVSCA